MSHFNHLARLTSDVKVAVLPGGARFVSVTTDRTAKLWTLDGALERTFEMGAIRRVYCVAALRVLDASPALSFEYEESVNVVAVSPQTGPGHGGTVLDVHGQQETRCINLLLHYRWNSCGWETLARI